MEDGVNINVVVDITKDSIVILIDNSVVNMESVDVIMVGVVIFILLSCM